MSEEHERGTTSSRKALRERAEASLRASRTDIASMSSESIQSLVHELQVHQVELEIQNEELREAQAQLAESRDRYADLYEFAPVGYLTLGDRGAILEANLAAATMLGMERGVLIQRKITDFIARDAQDLFYLHRHAVDEQTGKQTCEVEMNPSTGAPIFVRLESALRRENPHAPAVCRTAMIDVTARRQAENELRTLNEQLDQRVRERTAEMFQALGDLQHEVAVRRENEERLRREAELNTGLIHTAQAVILTLDREGMILSFNTYMEKLSGYPLNAVQGRDWFQTFLPQELRIETRELFHMAIEGQRTSRNVTPIVTRSGQLRQIEWSDEALTDGKGNVTGLVCTGHDVTERMELEAKLNETSESLQAILNTAVDAIVSIDERGRILSVNPATQRLFGYSREEMVGQNVSMLMGSPHQQQHDDYLGNYLRTGEEKIIGIGREVLAQRKDGSSFPVDLVISRSHNRNGIVFTGIMRDISKRKELEQHMAQSREEERRHLAHEIHDGVGGLMTGIGLLAKLLQNKLQREESPYADSAVELVGHIREAHEQLRSISRGIQPVEVTTNGLEAALQQLAASTCLKGGPVCEFRSHGQLGIRHQTHSIHLYRIAQEAVSNALRHAKASHITIDLKAEPEQLRLTVRDDGIGIYSSSDGSESMGLRTMQYRAGQIGAAITIKAAADGGSVITCVYPNPAKNDATSRKSDS